jgi:hypothetical protein
VPEPSSSRYVETLRVPRTWWLIGGIFALTVWWVFFVAVPTVVAVGVGGLAAITVATALIRYGAVRVRVDDIGLHAGRAHLPWRYVGDVENLDAQQTRRVLGLEADARALLVMRPYCREAVKVCIGDSADTTPYWIVSTRHPADLARSLRAPTVQD